MLQLRHNYELAKGTRGTLMSRLKAALEAAGITIKKYDPEKARPVHTHDSTYTVGRFADNLRKALGKNLKNFPDVIDGIQDSSVMEEMLEEYSSAEGLGIGTGSGQIFIPQELSHLTLNIDRSSKEASAKRFFCTTPEEIVDPNFSGAYYIDALKITTQEAAGIARAVVPRYMPRKGPGVHPEFDEATNAVVPYFNTYIPPRWERWRRRNPKLWAKIPAKPPTDLIRMLKHIIPIKEEREYLYGWIYTSLVGRAYVYPILQGNPGVGKNRIKILLRALHGEHNSADGKKETFGANQSKFNSQMEAITFAQFDELEITREMEPRMKEYQNPFISIERKGVDATRSTEIFCSMVVSNNHLRDNYLPFDSRKFAPLVLGDKPLKEVMTEQEIGDISNKLGEIPDKMDVRYVAQIAKWILTIGQKHAAKYRNLEYSGPKFWEIAHASMSRWQKLTVLALTTHNARGPIPGWDKEKGAFLWSKAEESLRRKKEFDVGHIHMATIAPFLAAYRDRQGNQVFEIEKVHDSVMDDFWVRPLKGLEKMSMSDSPDSEKTEQEVGQETDDASKLVRPPGISQFQWRKMKMEWEVTQGTKGLEDVISDKENEDEEKDDL
jgi:hypothetical protein